jgi:hypothetical protein
MEVPGWRRFVPSERRLNGDIGSGSARTQSTPQGASRGMPQKEEVARQSLHSRQQHFSGQPPESGSQHEQAGIGDATEDKTDANNLVAKHRETVLREFLRGREQLLLSHKQPPQSTEDVLK